MVAVSRGGRQSWRHRHHLAHRDPGVDACSIVASSGGDGPVSRTTAHQRGLPSRLACQGSAGAPGRVGHRGSAPPGIPEFASFPRPRWAWHNLSDGVLIVAFSQLSCLPGYWLRERAAEATCSNSATTRPTYGINPRCTCLARARSALCDGSDGARVRDQDHPVFASPQRLLALLGVRLTRFTSPTIRFAG